MAQLGPFRTVGLAADDLTLLSKPLLCVGHVSDAMTKDTHTNKETFVFRASGLITKEAQFTASKSAKTA